MAFQRVGSLPALPEGSMTEIEIGTARIALCRVEGEVHAIDGVCPHRGGPLGMGALHGKMVVCPWHAWEFDCTTGANDYDPDLKQRKFAVRIEGEEIFADVG